MEKLRNLSDPQIVKIISGVRRCGKSTLMRQMRDHLLGEGAHPESMLYVDFELASSVRLTEAREFTAYALDKLPREGGTLFVDEVQELEAWPQVINVIRAERHCDVYVTGSNSRAFAGEKMTYLSGRYVTIEVYPLSMAEYRSFKESLGKSMEGDGLYRDYVREGGFPAVALARNPDLRRSLLDGIYDSVFARDVILRGGIRNEAAFLRVASFVLENIGSLTSAHAIANTLRSSGHRISVDAVDNYLELMTRAYLLYRCERYDIRGKERLRNNGKYYVVDTALRARAIGREWGDRGHIVENEVFLELKRRGYDVHVGILPNAEIDFVAQRHGERAYVQVSESVVDPVTRERELSPFRKLDDGFPRVLITQDADDYSDNGVRHLQLPRFLLGESW